MAYQTGTATDYADLLDKIATFVETTMTPAAERWTVERDTGYESLVFSSELGSFEAFRAFDGNVADGWRTALGSPTPSYLGCKFLSAVDINAFAIEIPSASGEASKAPNSFSLDYSDDGVSWTTLQSYSSTSWGDGERRRFAVTAGSPGARLYWRVYVTANQGDTNHTAIAELELFEDIASNDFNHATERQVILNGPGLSAADEIYVGLQLYSLPTSDIYNMRVAGFTGYVASNSFDTQPGTSGNIGVPLWDDTITYWLVANGQRIACVAKVETTYQFFYLGKILPFATPGQDPYPVLAAGMLASDAVTRYSDSSIQMPWAAASGKSRLRRPDGSWKQAEHWPYNQASTMRDTISEYALMPIALNDSAGVYGELDGVFQVSGFSNAVENLVQVGSLDHLVVQDVYRTGIRDYFALALE